MVSYLKSFVYITELFSENILYNYLSILSKFQ